MSYFYNYFKKIRNLKNENKKLKKENEKIIKEQELIIKATKCLIISSRFYYFKSKKIELENEKLRKVFYNQGIILNKQENGLCKQNKSIKKLKKINIILIEKLKQSELKCPICFEKIKPIYFKMFDCGHFICKVCNKKIILKKCPICRNKF